MGPPAPEHLQPSTKEWWEGIMAEYALTAADLRLLQLAAEAWDAVQLARQTIAREGAVYLDRFDAPRSHPAVAQERDHRIAFARLLRELDLDGTPDPDPRLPRKR